MGSSFVGIAEKGFWMRDWILELWLRLLALHIEDPAIKSPPGGPVQQRIRDQWLLASRGYFGGCVPNDLEEGVATAEGREAVTHAIESLLSDLSKCPENLDHNTLNLLGIKNGVFTEGVEAARLIEVGNAFLALINGQIQSDASSTEFMPGSQLTT